MTDHNPISPLNLVPEELLDKWVEDWPHFKVKHIELVPYIAAMAAQWGADQELEACCELLRQWGFNETLPRLQRIRRPKPPSLKEQSLALIDLIQGNEKAWDIRDLDVVRRALEQIDD
jgi:hypothetical protein